jgi:hypothetical protein
MSLLLVRLQYNWLFVDSLRHRCCVLMPGDCVQDRLTQVHPLPWLHGACTRLAVSARVGMNGCCILAQLELRIARAVTY